MKIQFWSSTEYSGFLEGLMRELNACGFASRQRFQISEASYRSARSPVARLLLRLRQYVVYPLQLLVVLSIERLLRRQATVCVVCTNTFYVPLIATFLHPNVVHLVYDLFPEAIIHSGKWKEGTSKVRCIRWITKHAIRRAKVNVFLGQRLKDYVESLHGSVSNAIVIEVGSDQSLFEQGPRERSLVKSENLQAEALEDTVPQILYCGNFGNLHDSRTLFGFWSEDAESLKSEKESVKGLVTRFRWRFHCSGPKRAELVRVQASLPDSFKNQIQIGAGLGQAEWITAMESADIALVTMSPGSETVVMPSKTYSAMMAGQAILAIAPEDSDLVDTIKTAHCGWWVAPGDVAGLSEVLETICSNPKELIERRENAYVYAHEHFGQDTLAARWQGLFKQLM